MSVYLMVSLHANALNPSQDSHRNHGVSPVTSKFSVHPGWNEHMGWKHLRVEPAFSVPTLGDV